MPTPNRPPSVQKDESAAGEETSGYTVIEALIVACLMLMVGIIVSPTLVQAWHHTRRSLLQQDLEYLRSRIAVYRAEHGSRGPHLNEREENDSGNMVERLTDSTYTSGKVSNLGPCGPYVYDWPANPFGDRSVARAVKFGRSAVPPCDGTTGWYYNLDTCLISSNAAEDDGEATAVHRGGAAILHRDGGTDRPDRGLKLQGIFHGPDGVVAFINAQRLHVGETIEGAKVMEIGWDYVVLQRDQQCEMLRMAAPSPDAEDVDVSLQIRPFSADPCAPAGE
jgi:type II secretory pathway pseudopilin PulG